jgi:hypothetical protein
MRELLSKVQAANSNTVINEATALGDVMDATIKAEIAPNLTCFPTCFQPSEPSAKTLVILVVSAKPG